MNAGAGYGMPLLVTVRLGNGEDYLFALDTGAAISAVDISLQSKLGPRLDTANLWRWDGREDSGVYPSPGFFLGGVPLHKSGPYILTTNLKDMLVDSRPMMGLIGMDVLKNYCLQLDFAAGKIHFVDEHLADKRDWGMPFHLHNVGDGCISIRDNLAGLKDSGSLIDTGCNYDGWLAANIFQQWTNHTASLADGNLHFPNASLGGQAYPHTFHIRRLDPNLSAGDDMHKCGNGIGLHILSRNLVTFDFPHHTIYLKRVSTDPVVSETTRSAIAVLEKMKNDGRLPGWSKNDPDAACLEPFDFPDDQNVIFSLMKKDDLSVYHYSYNCGAGRESWVLNRAWRTDSGGNILKEFEVH